MKYSYFNFKKWNEQQILLTNDLGQWAFVSLPTFQAMRMFIWNAIAVLSEKQKGI